VKDGIVLNVDTDTTTLRSIVETLIVVAYGQKGRKKECREITKNRKLNPSEMFLKLQIVIVLLCDYATAYFLPPVPPIRASIGLYTTHEEDLERAIDLLMGRKPKQYPPPKQTPTPGPAPIHLPSGLEERLTFTKVASGKAEELAKQQKVVVEEQKAAATATMMAAQKKAHAVRQLAAQQAQKATEERRKAEAAAKQKKAHADRQLATQQAQMAAEERRKAEAAAKQKKADADRQLVAQQTQKATEERRKAEAAATMIAAQDERKQKAEEERVAQDPPTNLSKVKSEVVASARQIRSDAKANATAPPPPPPPPPTVLTNQQFSPPIFSKSKREIYTQALRKLATSNLQKAQLATSHIAQITSSTIPPTKKFLSNIKASTSSHLHELKFHCDPKIIKLCATLQVWRQSLPILYDLSRPSNIPGAYFMVLIGSQQITKVSEPPLLRCARSHLNGYRRPHIHY